MFQIMSCRYFIMIWIAFTFYAHSRWTETDLEHFAVKISWVFFLPRTLIGLSDRESRSMHTDDWNRDSIVKKLVVQVNENCWSQWDYSVKPKKNLFEIFFRKAPLLTDPVYLPFRPDQDVFGTPYLLERPFPCSVHLPGWLFEEE